MNLLLSIIGQRRRFDPDAADYFSRIVAAGSTISEANKSAVNAFVVGCKTDGIWSAIKAGCILAASDTLNGALVPLVGAAPTNYGFSEIHYNKITGLSGDVGRYLDSNRLNSADPQNSNHNAVWTGFAIGNGFYMGAGRIETGSNTLFGDGRNRSRNTALFGSITSPGPVNFYGFSRTSSLSVNSRINGVTTSYSNTSQSPYAANVFVFRSNSGSDLVQACTLRFYSIGEAIDLALLDARLTTLFSSLT